MERQFLYLNRLQGSYHWNFCLSFSEVAELLCDVRFRQPPGVMTQLATVCICVEKIQKHG